ncbi:hypothetical protein SLS60_008703 [Paraconiothyrium brasiliense]|uniref:Uncharacterized protein n=1 Tax=Paraconiothyrium brasiliense TaxID=300254 RepID=A0ABR3QY85_9PLEO
MSDIDDIDNIHSDLDLDLDFDLPPLGSALATPASSLIYTEAQRQYSALVKTSSQSARLTCWRVDLQRFYQLQFERATTELDTTQTEKLMTICFAYKTRSLVLCYLDCLFDDDGAPLTDWVRAVRDVVQRCGRDGMEAAEDVVVEVSQDAGSSRSATATATPDAQPASELDLPTFTIPTLPLAYPTQYFSAWAQHVPVSHLTLGGLLSQPAVYGLALDRRVSELVRANCGHVFGTDAEEDSLDPAFITSLCVGREKLEGIDPLGEWDGHLWAGKGYGIRELVIFVEGWKMLRTRGVLGEWTEEGTGGREDSLEPLAERDAGHGDGGKGKKRVRFVIDEDDEEEEEQEVAVERSPRGDRKRSRRVVLDEDDEDDEDEVEPSGSRKRVRWADDDDDE